MAVPSSSISGICVREKRSAREILAFFSLHGGNSCVDVGGPCDGS